MAPHYGFSPRMKMHEVDLELNTRWWGDYRGKFNDRAKPTDTFNSYIGDVFNRPKKLVRSASFTSLTYTREANVSTFPLATSLRKSPSVSTLSPSHRLQYADRTPERYIPAYRSYKPESGNWYTRTYAPTSWKTVNREVKHEPNYSSRSTASTYSPYTQFYTRKAYGPSPTVPPSMSSYVRGSERYMKDYVQGRINTWTKALPYFHNTYESQKSSTDRFDRHLYGSSVFVPSPTGLPAKYKGASHRYRMYKLSDKLLNFN